MRAGFRSLLEGGQHITVVGEAARGDEAVALARRVRPDVVLMDATLPGLDAVEATRRLAAAPGVRVMVLTTGANEESRSSRRCGPARAASWPRTPSRPSCCEPSAWSPAESRCCRPPSRAG